MSTLGAQPSDDADMEIATLIATLHETERRIEELTGGEVDTVMAHDGRTLILRRAQDQMRHDEVVRQAAILNALPANVALLDANGTIVSVNETWRRFAAENSMKDPTTGIGQNYVEVCGKAVGRDSAGAQETAAGLLSVLSGEANVFSIEYPCHSSSERRWFQLIVTPLADHRRRGAVAMHLDITKRRMAEDVLQESEERFAAAFTQASNGVALVSLDGRWLKANQALCDLLGFSEQELLNRTIIDLTHPDDAAISQENIRRAIAGETRSAQMEKRYVHKSGRTIEAMLSTALVRDANGRPLYFVSQIQDVTERKRAEDELRASNEKFHQIADNIADAFWIRSADMQEVLYISPAFERIWERSVSVLHANPRSWADFILPEDRERVLRTFFNPAEGSTLDIEYRIVRPSGEVRWVRVRGRRVLNDEGKLIRNIGIVSDITDRHRAAAELRESEAEFRTLAEAMPQIVWIALPGQEITYLNRQWLMYTGVSFEESRGDGWIQSIHPDDRQPTIDAWEQAKARGTIYSIESRLRRTDGAFRWWLLRAVPLRDEKGAITKWIGTATDFHDIKVAELEISRANLDLEASQRRFTDLLGNVDMISLMLDTDGRVTYCNDYLLRLIGWTREELVGQNWLEKVVAVESDMRIVFAQLLANMPSSWHHENEILTRSGEQRLIQWNNTLLRTALGEVIGTASLGIDVTDSRKADERLRLQSAALNAAGNAIIITDSSFDIVWSNPSFTDLTGYSADEAIGHDPRALLHSDVHDAAFYRQISEAIREGKSWHGQMTSRRKNGTLYPEAQTITPVTDDDGTIRNFISIKTDLTAHRQMEAQLRQAQKMEAVGQLAAGVAHEFNNLLQALMSMSAMMRFRAPSPEITALGTDMEALIRRGAGLTQQLLIFSRHHTIEMADLDAGDQLLKASQLLRHLVPETIAIVVEPAREPLRVQGDAGQIQQVLLNLAINARDAMPAGGTLTLRCGRDGSNVFQEVQDTGEGMDAETKAHLFEPFFTTKPPGKGTGLGLAVAHGIAEQHGGRIEVESSPGHGSRFRMLLPASLSSSSPLAEPADAAPVSGVGGRLLLVEDDPAVRTGVSLLLEMIGYEVISVGSAEEAIELALEPPPDVLLSDVTLPGMAGPDLVVRLRNRWPSLRAVLMSGYVKEGIQAEAIAAGWRFLQKPFEFAALAQELETAQREIPTPAP